MSVSFETLRRWCCCFGQENTKENKSVPKPIALENKGSDAGTKETRSESIDHQLFDAFEKSGYTPKSGKPRTPRVNQR